MKKIIHYCWFGGDMPELVLNCIESWRAKCPDYEFYLWNEENFDVTKNNYTFEAYEKKKFAFVADYARLKALYDHGGIYLDTDVELISSLDSFLDNECFFGFEDKEMVSTGIFGANKGNEFIKERMDAYNSRSFILDNGELDTTTNVAVVTSALRERGLISDTGFTQTVDGIIVYPREFFGAKDHVTGRINRGENTVAVHHYTGSWLSDSQKLKQRTLHFIGPVGAKFVLGVKSVINKVIQK